MSSPIPLFKYQDEAADVMAERDRFGLHDEMGIGKTATTIGAINKAFGQRGMIVCPAMLRENWINEFKKFSTYDLKLCKGRNIHDFIAWTRGRFDVLITSYELATKWYEDYKSHAEFLDFLAFDEAHFLKNHMSARSIAMLGTEANGENCLVEYALHAYHVTGTPMANDPMDIYTFLKFAKAIQLNPQEFTKTFFEVRRTTYGQRTMVRPEMTKILQDLIYNNAIRRTHRDVGMHLPPIWMQEVLVDGDTSEITAMIREYPGLEQAIIEAIDKGGLSFIEAQHIATLRRLVGTAKMVPYAQMLEFEMKAGAAKRVVFGIHTEPLVYLQNYMWRHGFDFVLVNGSTPEHERQENVRRFMNDPKCVGFIGNIKVAGVGLTLTESSEIDMFESDWSPAGNAQAIKRVHRYGQWRDVRARFITLAKSIDVGVNRIVAGKTASIAQIEGDAMTAAPLLTV